MQATLYAQAQEIEEIDKRLIELNSPNQIDVIGLQRSLLQSYEENPVFYDAIKGKMTIEDSLNELAQINKPVRRLFPRRKDKVHNRRIEQIGELITRSFHLKTKGILGFDNFVGVTAMTALGCYSLFNLTIPYVVNGLCGETNPIETQQFAIFMKNIITPVITLGTSPFMGVLAQIERSTGGLPTDEAKYLDDKIKDFYVSSA